MFKIMNNKAMFLGGTVILVLLLILVFWNEEQERNNKLALAEIDLEKIRLSNSNFSKENEQIPIKERNPIGFKK